jgi:phytoene dehydrogenase-like protein
MTDTPDVIVVGGGHNGLIAACYLARSGVDVLVVEADRRPGGMMSTNSTILEAPGHRINEGAMDVSMFRASTIAADLQLKRFGFEERVVDPAYAFLDADDASLCIWRDPVRTAEEIRRFSRPDASAYLELARELDVMIDVAVPYMTAHPTRPAPGSVLAALKAVARHPKVASRLAAYLTMSQAEMIASRFEHPLVRGPLAAVPCFSQIARDGTAWALIYFGFIHRYGISRVIGGTGALTDALARCLLASGGRITTSATVEQIVVNGGRAGGVRLSDGEELGARAVLAACNPKVTLTELLPDGCLDTRTARAAEHIPTDGQHASSFKVDVALSGRLTLQRHQARRDDGVDLRKPVVCWATFEQHLAAWEACARGVLPEPLAGCSIVPTGLDPSQAPPGQDTFWFWTGIAPAHPHEPWEALSERATDAALAQASVYYDGFDALEIARRTSTPVDIARRFRVPDGNVYHVDTTSLRFGPLRPAPRLGGYATPVEGLFLTGAGTHPVAGICGIPGQLAARTILRTWTKAADRGRPRNTADIDPPPRVETPPPREAAGVRP